MSTALWLSLGNVAIAILNLVVISRLLRQERQIWERLAASNLLRDSAPTADIYGRPHHEQ